MHMWVRNKSVLIVYRMLVAILAMIGAWMCFDSFGITAWRVFVTYILIGLAIYFGISAVLGLILRKKNNKILTLPLFEGALIIGSLVASITTFVFLAHGWRHLVLTGGTAALVYVTLPILLITDWLIFVPKGRWQGIYPFYWLAFPTFYVAAILFSAEVWSHISTPYPLEFLNYREYDIAWVIWVLIFYAVCILIVGYGFYIIDALMSGKVGKHVVLPKIKLVEVEEEFEQKDAKKVKKTKNGNRADKIIKSTNTSSKAKTS